MSKSIYSPTETHLALHPQMGLLLKCKCGVMFVPRKRNSHEDNPRKCLTCNRQKWSKLVAHNVPVSAQNKAHVLPLKKRG